MSLYFSTEMELKISLCPWLHHSDDRYLVKVEANLGNLYGHFLINKGQHARSRNRMMKLSRPSKLLSSRKNLLQ